jgi:predicted Zn-dependent protease
LEKQLLWLLAEYEKGTKLSKIHYNYLLLYGNNCYYLADIYMFNRPLLGTSEKLPTDAMSRYEAALKYMEEAIEAYEKLEKMRPSHPNFKMNMASTYRLKGRLQGQFMGDLNACILSLEKSLEYEDDAETYRLLGVANGIAGRHFIAIEFFEKGMEYASESSKVDLLYNLEVAYRQLSERAENREDAEKYLIKAESYQMQWKAIDPKYDPTKIKD